MSTFHALLVAEASLAASANRHPSPMCVSEAPGRCDSYRRSPVLLQCQDRDEVVVAKRAGYGERIVVKVMPARGQRCPARKSYLEDQGKRARCGLEILGEDGVEVVKKMGGRDLAPGTSLLPALQARLDPSGRRGPSAGLQIRNRWFMPPAPRPSCPSRCRKALNDPASAAPAWLRRAPRQRRR
jgi:hypothetical protein